MSRILVGNYSVEYSDVVGVSPVGAPNYIFIIDLTPGFNGLGKDNCKMSRELFKFCDLVRLILESLRYVAQTRVRSIGSGSVNDCQRHRQYIEMRSVPALLYFVFARHILILYISFIVTSLALKYLPGIVFPLQRLECRKTVLSL